MEPKPTDPATVLASGVALLQPVLSPHGFAFVLGAAGRGSGGRFASGEFIRGDRRLELHFRHGLGLVQYHVGLATLDHESYMRYGGHWNERHYPDFSPDPLSSFAALAADLRAYCSDFLSGSGEQFAAYAAEHARNPNRFKGFGALGKNGALYLPSDRPEK